MEIKAYKMKFTAEQIAGILDGEVIGNPNADIVPLKEIAVIAHSHNIPVIVDNTFGSPYLFKAFDFGADIVVHSATKFLGGHGTTLGGVVVDSGNFNFNTEKFSMFINPDSNIKTFFQINH